MEIETLFESRQNPRNNNKSAGLASTNSSKQMLAKFSWEFNIINKKIDKKIQQSGDDYTTLSTTTKNDRKILTIYIYIYLR